MVTEPSVKIRLDQSAKVAISIEGYVTARQLEQMYADESRRDRVAQAAANALLSHILYARKSYSRDRPCDIPSSCDRASPWPQWTRQQSKETGYHL